MFETRGVVGQSSVARLLSEGLYTAALYALLLLRHQVLQALHVLLGLDCLSDAVAFLEQALCFGLLLIERSDVHFEALLDLFTLLALHLALVVLRD